MIISVCTIGIWKYLLNKFHKLAQFSQLSGSNVAFPEVNRTIYTAVQHANLL